MKYSNDLIEKYLAFLLKKDSRDVIMVENGEFDDVIAFILLITESAETHKVLDALRNLKEVIECYMIYGDWDILCKIKLERLSDLADFMIILREKYAIKKSTTLIALPK